MADHEPVSAEPCLIDVDVLIIGGGVMGLWLLNDLRRRGYGALLLERREIGGEQTCHSHVYIHQGFFYNQDLAGLSTRLKEVKACWDGWPPGASVTRGAMPAYIGFRNPAIGDKKEDLWKALELAEWSSVQPDEYPRALKPSALTRLYRSPEICLQGASLVRALWAPVEECTSRIDAVERISLDSDEQSRGYDTVNGVGVLVSGQDRRRVGFRPKALVLAAGAGNQELLELAAAGRHWLWERVRDAQQIRKAHMLVVRGPRGSLEALTGYFPDVGGLFIVSREDAESDEVVWMISDDRSPPVSSSQHWVKYDARDWLQRVVLSLQELAPLQFTPSHAASFRKLRWGVYEAPKAEGRAAAALPDQACIQRFQTRNLWVVWPTKLTLAPMASHTVSREIGQLLEEPSPAHPSPECWERQRRPLDDRSIVERWEKTPSLEWFEFCRSYSIDYA